MPRLALVTGAGRGIGRAIALELARRGCDIAVNYNHSAGPAEELVNELQALGVKAQAFQADVANREQVVALFKAVKSSQVLAEHDHGIEILVNNAGITRDGLLMRMKLEDWDAVINANLNSVFNCTKEALRDMAKARFGRIVNITSVVGLVGNVGQSNYSASKAGIIGFTKSVAREYAPRGILVNAVAPGCIATNMTEVLKDEVKAAILAQIPIGRVGAPEDVARAVAFLGSDENAYITGQVLAVDGGMTMC